MKNKCLLSPLEAAQELGVSPKTIHRSDASGKLHTVRTVGNQRRIPTEEVHQLQRQAMETAERCVIYARVSRVRQEQDDNLRQQANRLQEAATSRGYQVIQVITEQAPSMNELIPRMEKLLTLVESGAAEVMLIESPDRLVRFGSGWEGVRLEVLEQPSAQEPTKELIQDMLTIVTVFAGRFYGHRAKELRKRVESALKECEQAHGTGHPHNQTPT